MDRSEANIMDEILKQVKEGSLTIEEAKKKLAAYEDLGFAKVDLHRPMRQGFPEVIYGEGKSADQIMAILQSIQERGSDVLITRVAKEKAKTILLRHPEFTYAETGRILYWKAKEAKNNTDSYIAIICAGTSDLRVAEEAAITAEVMGSKVERIYDVGVAGLHRLVDHLDVIRKATVSVVIA